MLAVVGFLLTQYVHLPGDQFQEGPLEALTAVPLGAQAQVFSCEFYWHVLTTLYTVVRICVVGTLRFTFKQRCRVSS